MSSKSKKRLTDRSKFSKRKFAKSDHHVSINDCYLKPDFITQFSEAASQKKDVDIESGARFFAQPFPCWVLPNFLNSDEFIQSLKQDLDEVTMLSRNTDLFKFKQSADLKKSPLPAIKKLTKLLYEDCLPWMEQITNISLTNEIDLTCSVYENTDVLLCHDDMLRGRLVAFIYYLVPDWEEEDGGALDIFHSVEGEATEIARSLVPVSNNFVFFEVSLASFHQVAEVLKDKRRLSVNGWFRGPSSKAKIITEWPEQILSMPEAVQDIDLADWINPIYLKADTVLQIRCTFEEISEIELPEFLKEDKYTEVSEAINSDDSVTWKIVGPRNRHRFEEATSLPPIVKECMRVMHSEEMCFILSNLTGLALHPAAEIESSSSEDSGSDSDSLISCNSQSQPFKEKETKEANHEMAKCHSVARKWSHGCYTLLHDKLMEGRSELDAVLYFNCENWNPENGGFTSYVAKSEKQVLLRIEPKVNSLALVYTDGLTAKFVKYLNNRVRDNGNSGIFHDILTTYCEQPNK